MVVRSTGAGSLRAVVVGAGNMGQKWLHTALADPRLEVVSVVDISLPAAQGAATAAGLDISVAGTSLENVLAGAAIDVVLNATVPAAHLDVTMLALAAGAHVLGEKPAAQNLTEALALVAQAELSGRLFMVSQSRRYNAGLHAAREAVRELGACAVAGAVFARASHFGGFREEMDHPLLLDMAIHPFDTARYLLGQEPVAVYAEEHNPSWSWYRGDAATNAIFEMGDGSRFTYNGSWCSPGLETSWNGQWRISGEHGTVLWDGDSSPKSDTGSGVVDVGVRDLPHSGIAGALDEFVTAVLDGTMPRGEIHENVMSLAMVDAALESSRTGRRVLIDDMLEQARSAVQETQADNAIGTQIHLWEDTRVHLLGHGSR